MRATSIPKNIACTAVLSLALSGAVTVAQADSLPAYMQPIAGLAVSSEAETATKNVLALNTGMFELYGDAAKVFRKNILSRIRSSSACSRARAGGSSSIAPAWRRSRRRRCRSPINC